MAFNEHLLQAWIVGNSVVNTKIGKMWFRPVGKSIAEKNKQNIIKIECSEC